ncbi:hypothetical protein [Pseudomonas jessenii]|uniref:hypothetical protein n=1 Tax=Pseudomonas jessenii TaxID=77298 RepID=UPI0030BE67EA
MSDEHATIADVLELLVINQHALAAGLEEVALWIKERGSVETHENIVTALETLDLNAGAITAGIARLVSTNGR